MLRKIVRFILLLMAVSVFLFSSVMVFKYRLQMREGTQYVETLVQMAVTQRTEEPVLQAPENKESIIREPATPKTAKQELVTQEPEAIESDTETPTIRESAFQEPETKEPVIEEPTFQEPEAEETANNTDQPSELVQRQPETKAIHTPSRMAPIQVDFDVLRSENQDIVAWIYCSDTPINYPVVRAQDNDFYLHRLPDGRYNYGGTLFMDYRNAANLSDWNSVIYGHNMKNDSMFGTLTDYKQQSYFELHPEIFLLTPECDYVIKVAAGFVTSGNADVYNTFGLEDEEKVQLIRKWMDSSYFVSENYPSAEDRLVTLSTCSYEYDEARYVVIGTLEKLGD